MENKVLPITLEQVADIDNLYLAFLRIIQAIDNKKIKYYDFLGLQNQKFYEEIIGRKWDSYNEPKELMIDYLNEISLAIQDGYDPSKAEKIYSPKNQFNTRIMTRLSLMDEIVYQALINLIAKNSFSKLQISQMNSSFGSPLHDHVQYGTEVLDNNDYSPNFYKGHFSENYELYKENVNEQKKDPLNKFELETDISSYFDSISLHELLSLISKYAPLDEKVKHLFYNCLDKWTGTKEKRVHGKGIPTGPWGSSFIGNLFFLDLDIYLIHQKDVEYFRYMDDMRIFAKDEDAINKIISEFGIKVQGLGLVLKGSKTCVRKIDRDRTLQFISDYDMGDKKDSFLQFNKEGGAEFDRPKTIINKEYQETNLRLIIEDINKLKNQLDTDPKKFLAVKNDGILSQVLSTYKKIIEDSDIASFNFKPDEELIDFIFVLIKKVVGRIHVYLPFLRLYHYNTVVRDRIFDLLNISNSDTKEMLRYWIYEALLPFTLDDDQEKKLLNRFENETDFASYPLMKLIIGNIYKDRPDKRFAIIEKFNEKVSIEVDKDGITYPVTNQKELGSVPKKVDTGSSTKEKKEMLSICEKLQTCNPDDLTEEEYKIFDSPRFKNSQNIFLGENYRNDVIPKLVKYIRNDDNAVITTGQVSEIAGEKIPPYYSRTLLYSLAHEIKKTLRTLFIEYKFVIYGMDGKPNPKKNEVDIEIIKIKRN